MIRLISAMAIFFIATSSFADTPSAPLCTPLSLKADGNNIVLTAQLPKGASQVFLIKNNSSKSLWLDHPMKKTGANAGWSSYLRKDNWSALVVNRKEFAVSCAVIQPGNVEYLDCSKAITVCNGAQALNTKRKGTFWLAEDKSWNEISSAATKFAK